MGDPVILKLHEKVYENFIFTGLENLAWHSAPILSWLIQ